MTREESINTLEWAIPYLPTEIKKAVKVTVADMEKVEEAHSTKKDVKKLPYSDYPKPLTVTMELSSADILVLEEISCRKVETEEQAVHAIKLAMIHAD